MKKITVIIAIFFCISAQAQTFDTSRIIITPLVESIVYDNIAQFHLGDINDVPKFDPYWDTVKVWMLVSENKPDATIKTMIGYNVFYNSWEAQYWEMDVIYPARHQRKQVYTLCPDRKRKLPQDLIIWQTKDF